MRRHAARAWAMLALAAATGVADAHMMSEQVGDFYAGMLHPLTALEHVLPIVALSLWAGQRGPGHARGVLLVFPVALAIGAGLALRVAEPSWLTLVNVGSAVVLGLLVAASWRLPAPIFYGLAALFGLSHGLANGAAMTAKTAAYLFIPGLFLATLIVMFYAIEVVLRLKPYWTQIAVRVAGSWIAAIGILVLSLGLRGVKLG